MKFHHSRMPDRLPPRSLSTFALALAILVMPRAAFANTKPVANPDSATTAAGVPVDVNVTQNDTDADGDVLTLIASPIIIPPTNGTAIRLSGSTIRYTPNAGFNGFDSFQYEIGDGRGARARAMVTVRVGNRRPTCVPDSATTNAGVPVDVDVTANDSDPDMDPVALILSPIIIPPAHGTATRLSNSTIRYAPAAGYSGPDSLQYEIGDFLSGRCRTTVSLTVLAAANRPPVAVADSATTPADTAVTIDVISNDNDPDLDSLTFSANPIPVPPARGTATTVPPRSIRYVPAAGTSGPDSFTYEITDGRGGFARATVSINVTSGVAQLAVIDPAGAAAVTSPAYRKRISFASGGISASAVYTIRNTGTATLTLGAPGVSRVRGSIGTFSASLSSMSVPAGGSTTLNVSYSATADGFGNDFQEAQISLTSNASAVPTRFNVQLLYEMHFPEQGIRELANAISSPTNVPLGLADWEARLNFGFGSWGPNGGSENLPVIAAAVALWTQPARPDGDYRTWWQTFLEAQTGTAIPSVPDTLTYFKGRELMSITYDPSVVTSVVSAYAWTFTSKPGAGAGSLRDGAARYLQATWVSYGLSAGQAHVETGYINNKAKDPIIGLQRSGRGELKYRGPYVALASMRALSSHWGGDNRGVLLSRALGIDFNSPGVVSIEEDGQLGVFTALDRLKSTGKIPAGTDLFALTSTDRASFISLINDDSDPGPLLPLFGNVRAIVDLVFLGWPGIRATCLTENRNGFTAPTLGTAYYEEPFFSADDASIVIKGKEAHFLSPVVAPRNPPPGMTCTVDLSAGLLRAAQDGTPTEVITIPTTPPFFQIVLGPSGVQRIR